jgi:hypothetical protein
MRKIVDLYSSNRVNFQKEKSMGTSAVIFKGGQGEWPDVPRVHPEWFSICDDLEIPWGIYWMVDARYSPERHKGALKRTFPDGKFGKLGLWLDCEKPVITMKDRDYMKLPYAYWRPVESIVHGMIDFCGIQPGIYTGWGAWDLIFKTCPKAIQDFFAQAPLWTAQYGVTSPRLYGAWKKWTLWQYQENPDYSLFNGTDLEFDERFHVGEYPEPVESVGDRLLEDAVRLNDAALSAHLEELHLKFPEVFV